MTSIARPLAFLTIAAALILIGRCSSPHPQAPSRDSTRAMAARDTVLVIDSSLATALGLANRTIAALRARPRLSVPPRPDSGGLSQPQTDTVYARIADDSATIAGLQHTLAVVRDTLASVRARLPGVAETLRHDANRIGAADRVRKRDWVAGAVWEAGTTVPVGAYVGRAVWRLDLRVEVTDGPKEPATARLALGIRF